MNVLGYGGESVSVAFEEVDANDWGQKVHERDIVRKRTPCTRSQAIRCRSNAVKVNERQV
jgi:hypothetical protein